MLSHYLASRIHSSRGASGSVSLPAVRIATLGMAVGLAVMIVSVCVVIGFKHTIRDKVTGFGSHVVVRNFQSADGGEALPVCCSDSLRRALAHAPGVARVQRYATTQGLLKTDTDFLGVMLKGIGEEWDTLFMHQNLVAGSIPAYRAGAVSNDIVISRLMADKLGLAVGQRVFAYFLGTGTVRTRRFTVAGIYQTNLTRYDEALVFCSLPTVQRLNGWADDQASGLEMTVRDFSRLDETAYWLVRHVNRTTDRYGQTLTSATIHDLNPQIFSWLGLLDLNVWIILALMICVAAVTMTSGLLIIILERVPMIGILKALGARNGMVRHTFLWFGLYIIVKGLVIGNIIGIGLCLVQKHTGIVSLDPQTYYVSQAPVEISVPLIALLNVGTLAISTLILVVPTLLVSHIHPARTMKFGE